MRSASIAAAAALAAALTACATPVSGPPGTGEGYEWGTQPTSQTPYPPATQVFVIPPTRTVSLPARTPPSIIQSTLEKMPTAEVARWALPDHADRIVRVEFVRVWMPEIRYGGFFERPQASDQRGVCRVFVHGVNFRNYREQELTYQQHLDPPLEPYQVTDQYKYKVLGSTLTGDAASQAACEAALPYHDWFEAPSDDAVFRAANIVERARVGPSAFRLSCTEMVAGSGEQVTPTRACDPRAYLEKLTPNLIKRINGAPCEGALAGVAGPCWELTYHDPRAVGTGSEFHVLAAEGRVDLSQVLLPPM